MPRFSFPSCPHRGALSLLLAGLLACPPAALADIYKHVDADGNITFTDKPRPGAKRVVMDAGPKAATPSRPESGKSGTRASTKSSKRAAASPADFPKVDSATQRKRDDMRRQLLEEELRSEQGSLAGIRKQLLAGQGQPGSSLLHLLESVRLHEKNIEMLHKELERIQ